MYELKYILPPILADIFRLSRRVISYASNFNTLYSNKFWRNRYQGETVYVLGNGPSIGGINLALLSHRNIIVMNNFHKAKWGGEFQPVAHCIGEPPTSSAWIDPSIAINGTNALSYWLNLAAYDHLHNVEANKKIYYVLAGVEPNLWGQRLISLHGLAIGFQTTAILAIQVALYMGFTDIRLIGFDHDWLASPDYSRHFYSEKRDPEDRLNEMLYLEILLSVTRMWQGYYALKRAAIAHDARIVNMTDGSYLDVFERCEFK